MASPMHKFTQLDRIAPNKRDSEQRRADFKEIYDRFKKSDAAGQSSRCEQCGIPFCHMTCPLHNNIPDWLMLLNAGRYREGYALLASTNPMPEVTGRVCPQDRLCEMNCTLQQSTHGAVTIGALEKYLADMAFDEGWVTLPEAAKKQDQNVGIIGAGPAGLSAAWDLCAKGYGVTIYDANPKPGGLLVYGIPGFKLEKDTVFRRIALLQEAGVEFVQNCKVGHDIAFEDIRKKHNAVIIAIGVGKGRKLEVEGATKDNCVMAQDYLFTSAQNSMDENVALPEKLDAKGKNVVVIGGGDTAMDCLRTAIRQGAASVKCLYRRDRENMPGSQNEVNNAIDEGVEFVWLSSPKSIATDDKGNPVSVTAQKMVLGLPDGQGRRPPVPVENSDFTVQADMVIAALGFVADDVHSTFHSDLDVTGYGTIKTNPVTHATSLEDVFAVGDIARSAALVVWALRDGREVATAIDHAFKTTQTQTA